MPSGTLAAAAEMVLQATSASAVLSGSDKDTLLTPPTALRIMNQTTKLSVTDVCLCLENVMQSKFIWILQHFIMQTPCREFLKFVLRKSRC